MQESIPMLVLDLTSECKYNQNVHFVHPGEIVMAFNLIWYTHCDPCSNHLWTFGLQLPKNSNHLVRPTFLSVLPPFHHLVRPTFLSVLSPLHHLVRPTFPSVLPHLHHLVRPTFPSVLPPSTTLSGLHFRLYYLLSTSLARNMWHTLNYNQWF